MGSAPRQHHILPAMYLAGFTDTGTQGGTLQVLDYFRGVRYRAKPTRVAREHDYYRVYEPREDPNVVENDLSRLEGELALVLCRVVDTGIIRSGEELGNLLSLVALIHARGPRARHQLSESIKRTMRDALEGDQVTPQQWDALVATELRARVDPEAVPCFEEARSRLDGGHGSPKPLKC